ncbi:hypothetical protein N5079_06905 [Planotetraspora sp. A-T 1434]|uniref:hypothetical protein n=1 Tax=Planotetraspora sp. A-T 1434 TaxID=2979219 RepID=UPI0021C16FCF|nr:hypothetical protein [Planotetraspora sp. A-T 1434]MCT9929948.1 hypothetical protein [Planotetraspora sp. A-T 1434]
MTWADDITGRRNVLEDGMTLAGGRKSDPVLSVRRVFVHSSACARAAANARELKLSRARDDLQRLDRGLGSRHYPDAAAVTARVTVIGKQRRVAALPPITVGSCSETGKPTLAWQFDQEAIEAETATDGWYALLTNLDPARAGRRPSALEPFRSDRLLRSPGRRLDLVLDEATVQVAKMARRTVPGLQRCLKALR